MKYKFLFLFISICVIHAGAQNKLNQSLGKVAESNISEFGIDLNTGKHKVRVSIYSSTIFRIHATANETIEDFSYAIIANPAKQMHKLVQAENSITIETDSCKLEITKNPLRFKLFNKNGQILNEDEPAFGTSWLGEEVTTYKKMQDGERFIGLGEKTGNLNRRGEGYTNWNTDYFAYPSNGDPLYATIPFFIGIHNNLVYGLFLDNTHKTHFNFGASNNRFSSFTADAGDMNYYLIGNSTIKGIIESYTYLTGRMEMPSLWSIGFQQCRYSYYPEQEVLTIAKTFRDKKIPADVLYFDIHYMDQYKIFTWHKTFFPKPKRMLDELERLGFKNVVIVDPGIKVEKGYAAYEDGLKNDLFLKYPDGTNYTGEVWPGWCHFPDFTNPKARLWWGDAFKGYINDGIDGFWNDMNEPATWGQRFPNLVEANFEGRLASHREWRNVYGFNMARSTFEGTKKQLNGKRPFNLTRAAYAGIQRYAAIWTGDNRTDDDHMMAGVRLVNSLGLSGVANAGYDVGGFAGETTKETFCRWMQIGAFCPFFRSHKMIDAKDSEPWSYGEKVEEIVRNFINFRYQLMPYLYSTFYEATQNGMPVARSLAIDYTYDKMIYDVKYQNQYLFGQNIMVVPTESFKQITKVYLPQGNWYDLYNDNQLAGSQEIYTETPMEKLPLYVKSGSIIPMQNVVQNASEKPIDTLILHVYFGNNQTAFIYYEDAGDFYDYEKGKFYMRKMQFNGLNKSIVLENVLGDLQSKYKNIKFVLHGFASINNFKLNNIGINAKNETFEMIPGVSQFDPIGKAIESSKNVVKTISTKLDPKQISLTWE